MLELATLKRNFLGLFIAASLNFSLKIRDLTLWESCIILMSLQ